MKTPEERNTHYRILILFLSCIVLFLFLGLLAEWFSGKNASFYMVGLIICALFATNAYLKKGLTFRFICKTLVIKKEEVKGISLCPRCLGFYIGLSISLPISGIRPIDLPTDYGIMLSGIIVGLNALHGVLRRLDYSKVKFFTGDLSAFILGFLFGITTLVFSLSVKS
jgi:hypothetical protein